ncbi:MAG: class I SAM-dependent methyltransferase [Candidatus Omnitrophica bacterium]|nr:class I SAM-dependent methyltransferase [Candidatus Omnitrophota bacterium]MDE2008576.1 class I SAM-dependent methyltransferase [Candidatus Omnitrophota bacterium]MDE2214042.1 class I SAM-dependent methyltransferase [Candidatus Omnitrophota bacterium]MDE2230980.1 class I SAM-dependent methyltransferase [Candidatus Omnitrophota bacterium]
MMKRNAVIKPQGINSTLKRYGGFVRYFDSTEPLPRLAALITAAGDCPNILACCGGGDQALTMLGAGCRKGTLWAVDLNCAQLFVLAAKAFFIKQNNMMPSFEQLHRAHHGQITAIKRNFRHLQQMYLYNKATGERILPPAGLAEKYSFITAGEMVLNPESGPFWKKDPSFVARVRARLGSLRFAQMDIFDSPDYFRKRSLDVIYLSDIFWQEPLEYYRAKLAGMAGLLRPGGRIIGYLDPGNDFMGGGVSPGRVLAQQARPLGLKVDLGESDSGYLVLEKTRRAR